MERTVIQASLRGISKLYLLVLSLGVTRALSQIPEVNCNWTFASYVLLLFGFLATVLRSVLKSFILLDYVSLVKTKAWDACYFLVVVLCLLTGLTFYMVGANTLNLREFMLYTMIMVVVDSSVIFLSHRPWEKGGLGFFIQKSISILTAYWLFPQYNPRHETDAEKRLIKKTHYQWARSNIWLFAILWSSFTLWPVEGHPGGCPISWPQNLEEFVVWVHYMPQRAWANEIGLFCILFGFALWDFKTNFNFYFSSTNSAPSSASETAGIAKPNS